MNRVCLSVAIALLAIFYLPTSHADERRTATIDFNRDVRSVLSNGASDEEFRNVAIVDRVNTTMAAWMGVFI